MTFETLRLFRCSHTLWEGIQNRHEMLHHFYGKTENAKFCEHVDSLFLQLGVQKAWIPGLKPYKIVLLQSFTNRPFKV